MTISKTAAGHQVLKDRSARLTPRQRAALILVDGQRSVEDVLAATAPAGVTRADVEHLLTLGLVADEPGDSYPVPLFTEAGAATAARDRYLQAYAIAIELTAQLGPRGGPLNLAVEAAGSLGELQALAPRIRAAVGPAKFSRLEDALRGA
jgi:hypothetical protein